LPDLGAASPSAVQGTFLSLIPALPVAGQQELSICPVVGEGRQQRETGAEDSEQGDYCELLSTYAAARPNASDSQHQVLRGRSQREPEPQPPLFWPVNTLRADPSPVHAVAWLHSLFHADLYARLGRSYRQDQPTVKRIARLRAYGISQMQIARRLGLKPQEVSKALGQFYA
jgi:hypothetical protein